MGSIPVRVTKKEDGVAKLLHLLFCRPIRGISPGKSSRRLALLGSHTPPEDRRAACAARHSPGAGRGYFRQRRDSRIFLQAPRMRCLFFFCRPDANPFRAQSARLGSHSPLGVTRLKQLSIVLAEESPKQGVGRAEKGEATDNDYATACGQGKCPHNETFTRRNEGILAKGEIPVLYFKEHKRAPILFCRPLRYPF